MSPIKTKTLVVDDDPPTVAFIEKFVARCGHETRRAYSGEEAVTIAREFPPDAVVTGIIMPGLSGLEAATQILQFLPHCKFVFASGSAHHPEIRREYADHGFDERLLLAKPFSFAQLVAALNLAGIPTAPPPP